jgi:hypothetical protein
MPRRPMLSRIAHVSLVCACLACGVAETGGPLPLLAVTVTPITLDVPAGAEAPLAVSINRPAQTARIRWTSADPSIARLDTTVLLAAGPAVASVRAVRPGATLLTARVATDTDTAFVSVPVSVRAGTGLGAQP